MIVRKVWWRFWRWARLVLLGSVLLLMLAPQWPTFGDDAYRLQTIVEQRTFDFLTWEIQAVATKAEAVLSGGHRYLDPETRQQAVLDYLALIRESQRLNAEINQLYVDPAVADADAASQALQATLAQTRADMVQLRPLAEAVLQEQVGTILAEEGFGLWGQAWPPVMMHMSPLPSLLVVSPRDRIERVHAYSLETGLTTPQKEAMETAVYDDLNLSALIVPIGGMGTYPAMIMETSSINWLAEVTAHEWSHHWMSFHPIGIYYGTDPQVRIINETVASIIDKEIGNQVIDRFYPEYALPPTPPEPPVPEPEPDPTAPPPFDFRAEMAQTRIEVDRLLAAGEIEAAEAYMEARRRFFVDNGYAIRKLNQAYFAFYGAYAAEPGATGADPIGPAVREVRALSPTLREFMDNMAGVGSFADLEALLQALRLAGGADAPQIATD